MLAQSRLARLNTGGVVRITEGILKGSGPQGPQGPQGEQGSPAVVRGVVTSYNDLLTIPNVKGGDIWIVDEAGADGIEGHGWCYNPPTDVAPGEWVDCGRMRGDPGYLQSVSAQMSVETLEQNVSPAQQPVPVMWASLDWNDEEAIDGITGLVPILATPGGTTWTTTRVTHAAPRAYLFNIQLNFAVLNTVRGNVTIDLYRTSAEPSRQGIVSSYKHALDGLSTDDQSVNITWVGDTDASETWSVQVSGNIGADINSAFWQVGRLGGGYGPRGVPGIQGASTFFNTEVSVPSDLDSLTGAPGEARYVSSTGELYSWSVDASAWTLCGVIKGEQGDSSSGFTNYDAVSGVAAGVSETPPPAQSTGNTADQGIEIPLGTNDPHTPYFLRTAVEELETRAISRYVDEGDFSAKRDSPVRGSVAWIDTASPTQAGGYHAFDSNLPGGRAVIPLVMWGVGEPVGIDPATLPNGSLYVEY